MIFGSEMLLTAEDVNHLIVCEQNSVTKHTERSLPLEYDTESAENLLQVFRREILP